MLKPFFFSSSCAGSGFFSGAASFAVSMITALLPADTCPEAVCISISSAPPQMRIGVIGLISLPARNFRSTSAIRFPSFTLSPSFT